ncbi:hypothetical protein [Pseudomonas sp. RIT-PI-AD]|uniref:hypothetical protein n=1 Tax=Pseudomonas sp. RIT-PI-AD TaxID=3035294 RepID=UPI0021D8B770|nr:hypothetical protein [Pseudomonas sp. RIT-PI-AD]
MNPSLPLSEHRPSLPRGRGRWQLIALLAMVIGPMLLASAMYHWRFWVPEGRSFHGVLLGDGQTRVDIGVEGAAESRWQLLVTSADDCPEACQRLVYLARQIHIGLGRDASRGSHALASAAAPTAAYRQTLEREYPQLRRYGLDPARYRQGGGEGAPSLWILDPHGNLVLRYPADVDGKRVLDDLRHLLKLSKIG